MEPLLLGVVGGVSVALLVWLGKVPYDVRNHDRLIRDRDEDLATWVADTKLALDRRLKQILEELSARGGLYSGERLSQRALAKEETLHLWRDQERGAKRFVAGLAAREEVAHRVWRTLRGRPFPQLETPERAAKVLDYWRSPESYEGSPVLEVNDPTARTLDEAVREIE
jgi:hypothetical protein